MVAPTPDPPYIAVIFTSTRAAGGDADDGADDGYDEAARRMDELAAKQPGYLGVEPARETVGLTVSYWVDEASARAWKQVAEHLVVQREGAERWYLEYRVRVATVQRDYGAAVLGVAQAD